MDNNSTDSTIEIIEQNFPTVKVIKNHFNSGFAGGHNIGIKNNDAFDFLVTLNPDVRLQENYLSDIISKMLLKPNVGMAMGAFIRQDEKTVDSLGIYMQKNRRPFDFRQGQKFIPSTEDQYIFGPCGAAAVYRKEFIDDISIGEEFFDTNFFLYKEDVDVAWRGQLLGWDSLLVSSAKAFHERGWKVGDRDRINKHIRIHSFKNRYLLLLKNDDLINILIDFIWIVLFEIMAFFFILFKEPFLFKSYFIVLKKISETLQKRKITMAKRKRKALTIRKWFIKEEV